MNRLAVKVCAALAFAAAIGVGAAPAGANTGLPLEPAEVAAGAVDAPVLVPESGSAGPYNSFMCMLHTIAPQTPCMYS
ncbi:hypothetical protein F5X71_32785 [Nocardia brasiliensis]|uniref:Uncharacterized protein n=1 Tax=Nocardia brasiliensis TaxID=37326 RepID=A0A6G9XZT8_NOCBR|nr:hypothetical protein [Nocardia brasiliensis]QIS06444.1 hypothetical protein F5X71_32785 [Nocardia brasiliensis]